MAAGESLKSLIGTGISLGSLVLHVICVFATYPNAMGKYFRALGSPLKSRPVGVSVTEVFPLPWVEMSRSDLDPKTGRRTLGKQAAAWVGMWVGCLNHLHCGQRSNVCLFKASAAQNRILDQLKSKATIMLQEEAIAPPSGDQINKLLRLKMDDYRQYGGTLPLGQRAGVPARAAVVDCAEALHDWLPALAAQCEDPSLLLRPRSEWPERARRRCVHLGPSYPSLIDEAVSVGLMELHPESEIPVVGGVHAWGGGLRLLKMIKKIVGFHQGK